MTIRRKIRFQKRDRLDFEGISATATRAIFQGANTLPTIQFTIETTTETLQFELPLEESAKFIQQALDAYTSAVPSTPRARQRTLN
jgi:hypothetical protein